MEVEKALRFMQGIFEPEPVSSQFRFYGEDFAGRMLTGFTVEACTSTHVVPSKHTPPGVAEGWAASSRSSASAPLQDVG